MCEGQHFKFGRPYKFGKDSDTLESLLSKVLFESDFRNKSCTCVMKTFAIFLLSKNKLSRLEHVLFLQVSFASYFRKRLSKENFLVCHYLKTHCKFLSIGHELQRHVAWSLGDRR